MDARILQLMRSGAAADSVATLAVIEDPEFRARYDGHAPGLAEYLRDAVTAYAEQRRD